MGRRLAAQADVFSLQCLACIFALVLPIDEVLCTLTGLWTAVAALLCCVVRLRANGGCSVEPRG